LSDFAALGCFPMEMKPVGMITWRCCCRHGRCPVSRSPTLFRSPPPPTPVVPC
jgi:hypothetical protein